MTLSKLKILGTPYFRGYNLLLALFIGLLGAVIFSGCSQGGTSSGISTAASSATSSNTVASPTSGQASNSPKIQVVTAENFWGSLAAQLGGERVSVTNIINNPD